MNPFRHKVPGRSSVNDTAVLQGQMEIFPGTGPNNADMLQKGRVRDLNGSCIRWFEMKIFDTFLITGAKGCNFLSGTGAQGV